MVVLAMAQNLAPARYQMAVSLGWHIVVACFGMTMPAMIFLLHRRGLRGDDRALELAQRWSKVAAVLFAVGAVSGTILSFEMGLLWPGMMERFGDVIGIAFALEGVAFFVEAIFLGIYVYGWGRLPGRTHSLMLIPITAAGVAGSFLVLSVNSWMNAPTGFRLENGEAVDIDPIAAIFSDHVWLQFAHMYLAALMVTGFVMAGVYAIRLLQGHNTYLHRLGLGIPLSFAIIATPLQPLVGHFAAQQVADDQPVKLAAMEALQTTTESANLEVGGLYLDGELAGAVEIPVDGLLSFLAHNRFDATVVGLDAVPADERPPVGIVHASYTVMIALGTALVGLSAWAAWRTRRHGLIGLSNSTWFLRAVVIAGPAAVVALETGWITTEVGRQPWIVQGIMRTEDAVTEASYIWVTFTGVAVVYTVMTVGTLALLRSMSSRWAAGDLELHPPYSGAAVGDGAVSRPGEGGADV